MQAVNIVNLFYEQPGKRSYKNEVKPRKMRSWLFSIYFGQRNLLHWAKCKKHPCFILFTNHIKRNLKKENFQRKVAGLSLLYAHCEGNAANTNHGKF